MIITSEREGPHRRAVKRLMQRLELEDVAATAVLVDLAKRAGVDVLDLAKLIARS